MNETASPGGSRVRRIMTAAGVTLTLLLAAGAGCDSQQQRKLPSVQEKIEESHLAGQAKIKIGVSDNEPLMADLDHGVYRGFDIEIARYIADSLGYESDERIEFVPTTTEERIPALQGGRVDIVVSSFSMTEERAKLVSFAGPYFVTTQEVLVPVGLKDKIRTIEDLRNPAYRVCTSGGSTSERELANHRIDALVVQTVGECVQGMLNGRYHALSSDQTILAGFLSQYQGRFQLVQMPFGTSELLGVGVPITDPALRDLVAFFLQKSYEAGRKGQASPWQTAYNNTLGRWLGPENTQPPPQQVPELVDFDDKAPR
ncbi:transporter substrate-binding domain-containing protein [Micromonospora sp. NPDC049559]|uniref:transporter substrate-binding domain-containing protein n=1 Tax=Micromonospora sp. NPDC049559 TaxID=3155923 RepID=UPI0034167DB4